jgi:hypothetical protein
MSNERKAATEEEIALYDAMERALAKIDAAWVRITAERPNHRRLRSPRSMPPMRFLRLRERILAEPAWRSLITRRQERKTDAKRSDGIFLAE